MPDILHDFPIAAPPQDVFRAVSTGDGLAQWWTERSAGSPRFGADGGYSKRWVKVKLGPVPVWFPNTNARRRALGCHDLHHIVTGYETSLAGEMDEAWLDEPVATLRARLYLSTQSHAGRLS